MTVATPEPAVAVQAVSPAPRIVPALVNGQQVYIPCATWCITDHVAENERRLEDVAHVGPSSDLVVPGGEPGYRLLADARLGADLFAPVLEERAPFVVIDDGSEGFHLTPQQAWQFVERLTAFAEQVRALAASIDA
ncbi:hypothetical protein OG762_36730 [Streptomyces sp. NBC_01136]|uniref:DUF6907 domain-containing protein n=1 Tax=Streptomyces sp. NBC_01136 TaxID=2903754 RepID=UPI00386D2828|nr:hypothetical protein OG762_36730 [Streptomyces sp. NBC_01136]